MQFSTELLNDARSLYERETINGTDPFTLTDMMEDLLIEHGYYPEEASSLFACLAAL